MRVRHRHPRKSDRRRWLAAAAALAVLATGTTVWVVTRGPRIVIPDDPCATAPPLVTFEGVRLQPLAMTAFRAARSQAGRPIPVVESYRSCAEQRKACLGICGNAGGCSGTCAPPGKSWHQLGAAIDITQAGLNNRLIVGALEDNGWCESVPASDPGHFSFGGCH